MKTVWPVAQDIKDIATAMGSALPSRITDTVINQCIDGAVRNIIQHTKRTWIPVNEKRYFDGSGTGEMEVDDFISLTTVNIIGIQSTVTAPLDNVSPVVRANFPNTRIQIYKGSIPFYNNQWITIFPIGRSNIEIDARWGYAESIPDDLWLCAAYQAVAMGLNFSTYNADGFLIKWTEADVAEVRNRYDPFKHLGGMPGMSYRDIIKLYKRPSSYLIRKQQRIMV